MRPILLLFIPLLASSQSAPFLLGNVINLSPPAINADGGAILFAAAVAPDGTPQKGSNLYVFSEGTAGPPRRLTNYAGDVPQTGVTAVAYARGIAAYVATPGSPYGTEEVHLIDTSNSVDRKLASDSEGCVQPLCFPCYRPCVGPVHLSADGSKVLYAITRQQPFFVVDADGSGLAARLPVYQGGLAPSPRRVISRDGAIVFTSAAPSGPTFAAAATDVYLIHLDGTALQPVTRFGDARFYSANATISADGTLIAFESNFSEAGPQTANQIWVVRPDGTGLRRVSTGADPATQPSISADGSRLAFLQSGQVKLAMTAGDGTALTLTRLSTSRPDNVAISDDGSSFAFTLGPLSGEAATVVRISPSRNSDVQGFQSIYAPRFLNANGVAAAAGYATPPSPGSLISIYGVNLGSDELVQARDFPLSRSLGGLSLMVNGRAVPLLAVTPWQINAQLPQTAAPGTATFQVARQEETALPPVGAEVKDVAPANFSYPFTRGQLYYVQAAALHAGTGVAADMDHPAAAGENDRDLLRRFRRNRSDGGRRWAEPSLARGDRTAKASSADWRRRRGGCVCRAGIGDGRSVSGERGSAERAEARAPEHILARPQWGNELLRDCGEVNRPSVGTRQ